MELGIIFRPGRRPGPRHLTGWHAEKNVDIPQKEKDQWTIKDARLSSGGRMATISLKKLRFFHTIWWGIEIYGIQHFAAHVAQRICVRGGRLT